MCITAMRTDRQAAVVRRVSCRYGDAGEDPALPSRRGRTSCTVVGQSRRGGSRRCEVVAKGGISRPWSGSSPSYPRSSRCLLQSQRSCPHVQVQNWVSRGGFAQRNTEAGGCRTRDILIENVIFLDDIVEYLLGAFVDDQDFPLRIRG